MRSAHREEWHEQCVMCGHAAADERFHGPDGHVPLIERQTEPIRQSVEKVNRSGGEW